MMDTERQAQNIASKQSRLIIIVLESVFSSTSLILCLTRLTWLTWPPLMMMMMMIMMMMMMMMMDATSGGRAAASSGAHCAMSVSYV